MTTDFIFGLGGSLVFTGVELFVIVLIIWWFFFYPRRKMLLARLARKFGLRYPKRALTLRESKLEGTWQGCEVKMNPATGGGDSWILLKHPKLRDFLAVIKPRRPLRLFQDPISMMWSRRELFVKSLEFDNNFRILGTATLPVEEIITPPIQKKLIKLARKREYEIQIVKGGIFFTSKKEISDLDSAEFIFETLLAIINNIKEKS